MASNPYLARAQDLQDKRWAMADAYRANQLKEFETANQHIGQLLASGQVLDSATQQLRPLTEQEKASLSQSQQQVASHIKNLYNPSFDPATGFGGESSLHKLTDKLKITKPPTQGKTPPEQMNDLRSIQQKYQTVAPGTEELQKGKIASEVSTQALKDRIDSIPKLFPNATPEEVQKMQREVLDTAILGRIPRALKLYKLPDGSSQYFDANRPEDIPEGAQPASIGSVSHVVKVGSTEDYMLQAFGPHPNPAQIKQGLAEIAQAKSGTTVGERQVIHDNGDGTATIYTLTTTSGKRFPGASEVPVSHEQSSPEPSANLPKPTKVKPVAKASGRLTGGQTIPGRMPAKLQTELSALQQVKIPVENLIKSLEEAGATEQGGILDAAKSAYQFGKYKLGAKPDQARSDLIKNAAAVKILGAAPWVTIGRGKYLYEEIQQHLPSPSDSPGLMYDKVTWLRDNLIAPIETEIKTNTMRPGAEHPDPLGILQPEKP